MVIYLLSSMSRPRLVSDHDVFAAFDAAIAEHGPNGVTLGLVAQRLGVTAPALMRRFGSKQGLFAAFMKQQLAAQPGHLDTVAGGVDVKALDAEDLGVQARLQQVGGDRALADVAAEVQDADFHGFPFGANLASAFMSGVLRMTFAADRIAGALWEQTQWALEIGRAHV